MLFVFKDATSNYKVWRKFLVATFHSDGAVWLVANNHTIDGEDERQIPKGEDDFRSKAVFFLVFVVTQRFQCRPL